MIKPIGDRVVIKVIEREEKTASGLFLPDTAKDKPTEAEVIAVGLGKVVGDKVLPLEVNVGDRVIFSKFAGTELKLDGAEYLVLRESDILAVIER